MTYQLAIGNKTLSSWSVRPWVLMSHFDIPFDEVMVRLNRPEFRMEIKAHSPSGTVPCLKDNERFVWDSLAIAEYLAERHTEHAMWPVDFGARAFARCITAEMHSGFSSLRSVWPMDLSVKNLGVVCGVSVRRDLDRIFEGWTEAREKYGANGPYLFGDFSIADAFFAPVVFRIQTYGPVFMSDVVRMYCRTVLENSAVKAWVRGSAEEIAAGWYR